MHQSIFARQHRDTKNIYLSIRRSDSEFWVTCIQWGIIFAEPRDPPVSISQWFRTTAKSFWSLVGLSFWLISFWAATFLLCRVFYFIYFNHCYCRQICFFFAPLCNCLWWRYWTRNIGGFKLLSPADTFYALK